MRPLPDLGELLTSWELALRAERKSAQTIKAYGDGIRRYLSWCADEGRHPSIERASVSAFVADLLETGAEPATARSRQLALRRFAAWLADEGEIAADPLRALKPPKLDTKVVHPLTDDQLRALIAACAGPAMRNRRDEAIVRLMLESGVRAGEVVAMTLPDLDLRNGTVIVRRGKGGKGRLVAFGAQTTRAVDRYLRLRRQHRLAAADLLWLGDRGKQFSYYGLHSALRARALHAGIANFHPHRLRHTAAHRWLAAGGSEAGLMAMAGWTRPDMLLRYTQAQASDRAAAEARRLNLGDL
jgi:site-specific recombinase XerD